MEFAVRTLPPLPEIEPGDDLAELIASALDDTRLRLRSSDVVALPHKLVSKAEGRIRNLTSVVPGTEALQLGKTTEKDPRLVQTILEESTEVVLATTGVLICRTHHGFVCANAGVDRSNSGGDESVVLLPQDPDRSARNLRQALGELVGVRPAVLIADSFGRAWRIGQCDVAIGCAGIVALDDRRGQFDRDGKALEATEIAIADQIAAAADLARSKSGDSPAALIRGLGRFVTAENGPGALQLLRDKKSDLVSASLRIDRHSQSTDPCNKTNSL